jgi:hypothetical protein
LGLSPGLGQENVLLPNTLDYPSYALAVERQRTAFRVAYSLLDKIAFFLNDYFSVGREPQQNLVREGQQNPSSPLRENRRVDSVPTLLISWPT